MFLAPLVGSYLALEQLTLATPGMFALEQCQPVVVAVVTLDLMLAALLAQRAALLHWSRVELWHIVVVTSTSILDLV